MQHIGLFPENKDNCSLRGCKVNAHGVGVGSLSLKLASPLLCILFLSGSILSASAENVSLPNAADLSKAFETPQETPWVLSDDTAYSRILTLEGAHVWDLRYCRSINVKANRESNNPSVLRLHWFIHTRTGWFSTLNPTVIPSGAATPVLLDCDGILVPVGHQRPWDALAAAEVVGLELRAECTFSHAVKENSISVLLSGASLKLRDKPDVVKATILDMSLEKAPAGYAARNVLKFRIEPPPLDPYAATGEGDVRVILPGGKQALAFLDQEYTQLSEGEYSRDLTCGPPYWRAFIAELPQSGVLEISSGERRWKVPVERIKSLTLDVPSRIEPARRTQRWEMPLVVEKPERFNNGIVNTWALSAGGTWERAPTNALDGATTLWRPVPFWNGGWGNFGGMFRPDCIQANEMDSLLAAAVSAGQTKPMVVLDGEMFGRSGTLKWEDHPLNGKLPGPGALFHTEAGSDFCRRSARYCAARWGLHKAVSAFWLTADTHAPGVAEFYGTLGTSLKDWGLLRSIALTPFAVAPQDVTQLATFEPEDRFPLGNWGVDQRANNATGRLYGNGGSEKTSCFEVRARDPKTTTIELLDVYSLPAIDWHTTAPDNFTDANMLLFDVWVPAVAPPDLRVGVHLRDKDGLWYEALLPGMAQPGDWLTYALDITGRNTNGLKESGHQKPWNDYSRQRITEAGIHLYSTHPEWIPPAPAKTGTPPPPAHPVVLAARFDNIRAVRFESLQPETQARIARVDINLETGLRTPHRDVAENLHAGDLWECHFTVSKTFPNPFDARQADLAALITLPSGKSVRVPAFFNQLCARHEETPGGAEAVAPFGEEFFTVRYRAAETGAHRATLELRENGSYTIEKSWQKDNRFTPEGKGQRAVAQYVGGINIEYPRMFDEGKRVVEKVTFVPGQVTATLDLGAAFTVAAAPAATFHGFLRAAQDKRHFEYEDGTFFYPIGPCLRSPSDSRIPYPDPKWNAEEIDRIGKRGTYQYDEYFAAFEKAGINWARVWMCSWWGSLEWRRDWPGFQGCGRYNLLNAWRIDHVLAEAERKGIAINLCLTNHGQYSLAIDREWSNNPYNSQLGGPLISACEVFTRADAKIAHQNKLRYVVARYSHSPAILAWALFSELEFTEEYYPSYDMEEQFPSINIDNWHSEMAPFLKSIDPSRHLVATHYSHPMHGVSTLKRPEIDVATSNAYSAFAELAENPTHEYDTPRRDAGAALSSFWSGNEFLPGFHSYNKPAMVEEQGRHWIGIDRRRINNTKVTLDADLHAGLWGSMVQPLAGATGYWWWLHLHFDNRYADYAALARFMKGEDMRPAKGETSLEPFYRIIPSPEGESLRGRALKSSKRAYIWVYHESTPLGREVPPVAGATLKIGGLDAGEYNVEFWDTYKGVITEQRDCKIEMEGGKPASLSLPLPIVTRDLAIKIKPKVK